VFVMPPVVSSVLFAALLLAAAVQLGVRAWRLRGTGKRADPAPEV